MPRLIALFELSQVFKFFAPFEALQPTQHNAIFSIVEMEIIGWYHFNIGATKQI